MPLDNVMAFDKSMNNYADKGGLLKVSKNTTEPQAALKDWFSSYSEAQGAEAFAKLEQEMKVEFLQEGSINSGGQMLKVLGKGSCGVVFQKNRCGKYLSWILKKAVNSDEDDRIMHEVLVSGHVHDILFRTAQEHGLDTLPRTPLVMRTIKPNPAASAPRDKLRPPIEDLKFWRSHRNRFGSAYETPTQVFIAERIRPLSKAMQDSLVDAFCDATKSKTVKEDPENNDCLWRLFLGRRRINKKHSKKKFTLRNYPLHLDQLEEICDETDIHRFARQMGSAMATLHWRTTPHSVGVDANKVKFLLGAGPHYENFRPNLHSGYQEFIEDPAMVNAYKHCNSRPVHLWLLDFDKCDDLVHNEDGMRRAAEIVESNEPYLPKPGSAEGTLEHRIWLTFSEAYLDLSEKLIQAEEDWKVENWRRKFPGKTKDGLPKEFLRQWESIVAAKANSGNSSPCTLSSG